MARVTKIAKSYGANILSVIFAICDICFFIASSVMASKYRYYNTNESACYTAWILVVWYAVVCACATIFHLIKLCNVFFICCEDLTEATKRNMTLCCDILIQIITLVWAWCVYNTCSDDPGFSTFIHAIALYNTACVFVGVVFMVMLVVLGVLCDSSDTPAPVVTSVV